MGESSAAQANNAWPCLKLEKAMVEKINMGLKIDGDNEESWLDEASYHRRFRPIGGFSESVVGIVQVFVCSEHTPPDPARLKLH
jgi:hypothetical protein